MLENEKIWILQNILSNVEEHNSAKLLRESLFKIIDGFAPLITASGAGIYTGSITPASTVPVEGDKVFLVTQPGTYTNFGNVVLPENNFGFIFKNGSSFSLQSVEMPTIPINGIVEESNVNAVSGGEVYNELNPISNIINGTVESITDLNSLPTGTLEDPTDTRYSYSDFIEIYPNSTVSYSLRVHAIFYIQFFDAEKVLISQKRKTELGTIVGNNELPPTGTKYVRFLTMNRAHPSNDNYNFYFKYYTSGGILSKIDVLENDVTDNSEDLSFIKTILNNSVIHYDRDDWETGAFYDPSLTTYNISPYYETGGMGKLHYSILVRGSVDYLRTYDSNYNIVRALTGESATLTKNYLGELEFNEDEVYFRIVTMNSTHSNYRPYDFLLETRYINGILDKIDVLENDITDNSEDLSFIKTILNNSVTHYDRDDWETGSFNNPSLTTYNISPYYKTRGKEKLHYSILLQGRFDYLRTYDSNYNIVRVLTGDSLLLTKNYLGELEFNEDEVYFRIVTMNSTHADYIPYDFILETRYINGILDKIDVLENGITDNSGDLSFIKTILKNSVIHYDRDDWETGSFYNPSLTTYNISPYCETRGMGKLHYSVLVRGDVDYLRTYDSNYNIVRALTGESLTLTKNYLGELDFNKDEVYFRIVTMNSTHSNYRPYDFLLETRYINTNESANFYDGLKSFTSDTTGNNLAIKAIKIYNIENQSPYYKDVLWNNTSTDEFYISKDVNSIRTKIFKFDSNISDGNSGMYSAFILQNGDILFVYRTEFAGGSTPLESTRKNPILYIAEDNYAPIVIDFGELNKPSGWLQNVGALFSKRHNRFYVSEYTRGNVPTARVWAVDMPLTDPQNWNIVLEQTIGQPYTSGFKHFHTVQEDPYTGVIYASSGDKPSVSFVWYSLDGGDTFIQLDEPSHAKWRMLNMVFLPDAIYWASDDWREAHRFWKIERDINGVMDISTLTQILVFPYEVTTEGSNLIATYACVFLECYNCILFLDRDDSGHASHIPVRLYDLTTKTLHDIGKVEASSPDIKPYGFRCETVDVYPKENKVTVSFGNNYGNNTSILGGEELNQINALEMIITKNDNKYALTWKEL